MGFLENFFGGNKKVETESQEPLYSVEKLTEALRRWEELTSAESHPDDVPLIEKSLDEIMAQMDNLPEAEQEKAFEAANLDEVSKEALAHKRYQYSKNRAAQE